MWRLPGAGVLTPEVAADLAVLRPKHWVRRRRKLCPFCRRRGPCDWGDGLGCCMSAANVGHWSATDGRFVIDADVTPESLVDLQREHAERFPGARVSR